VSNQVTVTPTGEESIDRRTIGDVFGTRRWLWGTAAIATIVLIGAVALWLRSTGGEPSEPYSSAFILPAEDGTSVTISRTSVPATQVQISGQGGQAPQTVVVLDEQTVFVDGQATLAPGADAELQRVLAAVRVSGDDVADVVGYTDPAQPDRAFLPLSRARADTVADWLVQQGEGVRRLDVDWRGTDGSESEPEELAEGETIDRAVEVRIDVPDLGVGAPPASGLGSDLDPAGVALAVDRVAVGPTAVVLEVRFSNPAPYPVQFNADGMWLVDDRGSTYRFVPSTQNPDLAVPAESSLSGQLSFPGVVTPGATRVTLLTNTEDPRTALEDALQSVADVLEALVEAGATTEEILSEAGTVEEIDAARDALIEGEGYEEPEPAFIVGDIPLPR
jgi:outer membrane protein OmpA-like peptidoglycan-associated protein